MNHYRGLQRGSGHFVSIVITVRDEAQSIPVLADEIDAALTREVFDWECLWIDDGSSDDTPCVLASLSERSRHHLFVQLDRNYGQSAALSAGFRHARGDIIVGLDGDGQNPPGEIPAIVTKLIDEDLDMVCGYRRRRYSFVRTASSRIANGFRNAVTGDNIRDVGCSLRAFRAECVQGVYSFHGMHRFLPTLVRLDGYDRIVEVPVEHRPRMRGRSKYGINNRLWIGIVDAFGVRWMLKRKVKPVVRAKSLESVGDGFAAANEQCINNIKEIER
jgi:dolichol-phosphate mannosyltransferase